MTARLRHAFQCGVVTLLVIAQNASPYSMPPTGRFFEILEELVRHRTEPLEHLAQQLGLSFNRSKRSTQYFDVYEAGSSAHYKQLKTAEVRVPVDRDSRKGGVISLTVDPHVECVGTDQIFSRFGDMPELSVPTPRQPATSPLYYVYRYAWGELRLGVSRGGKECLETAIIDYKQ